MVIRPFVRVVVHQLEPRYSPGVLSPSSGGDVRCSRQLTPWSGDNSTARMQASPTLRTTEYGGLDTSKGCYTLA